MRYLKSLLAKVLRTHEHVVVRFKETPPDDRILSISGARVFMPDLRFAEEVTMETGLPIAVWLSYPVENLGQESSSFTRVFLLGQNQKPDFSLEKFCVGINVLYNLLERKGVQPSDVLGNVRPDGTLTFTAPFAESAESHDYVAQRTHAWRALTSLIFEYKMPVRRALETLPAVMVAYLKGDSEYSQWFPR